MTRILFVGDLHIREGEHLGDIEACLAETVEMVNERNVDVVVQVGDCFEKKSSPAERLVLSNWLQAISCPVHLIRGNHDVLDDLLVFGGYPNVEVHERVATVDLPGGVAMVALPWPEKAHFAATGLTGQKAIESGREALDTVIKGAAAAFQGGQPFIIAGHILAGGAISSSGQPLIGASIEAAPHSFAESGAAFTALGHIHNPQEIGGDAHYVGSLTGHDFGEEDETKRVIVLDVETDGSTRMTSIPTRAREWVTVLGEVTEHGGVQISGKITGLAKDVNVRYRYTCTADQAHLFDHDEIRKRFERAHTLKFDPRIERVQRVRSEAVAKAKGPREKVVAFLESVGIELTENLEARLGELLDELLDKEAQ